MATSPQTLASSPPEVPDVLLSYPAEHIFLVTLNRPKQLNSLGFAHHPALQELFRWYDQEPSLRCAIITGSGRAFCAGADLKEWARRMAGRPQTESTSARPAEDARQKWADLGFGGLSNRAGKKPVIAAVNGLCLGGGMEMVVNTDLVVAAETAKFGFPEVKRGVVAVAGALPRLASYLGRQRATEMALLGGTYSAQEMMGWGLVNRVVPAAGLLGECIDLAKAIADNSPDAVIVSREGLRLGWDMAPRDATKKLAEDLFAKIDGGENMMEGVKSFVEKRKPIWRASKL